VAEIARDCLAFDAELSALLDGELGAGPLARVEAHLAGCARCRGRLAELRAVDLALAALPERAAPADLAERLARRLAAWRRAPGVAASRVAAWLAVPAAAAAALVLYLALRPTPAPEGPALAREPLAAPAPGEPAAPGDLEALETEELAVVLDLETMQDLPVIANLDLLERLLDEGSG
jgi:anti-sigma factor RsiW